MQVLKEASRCAGFIHCLASLRYSIGCNMVSRPGNNCGTQP
eukprot:gene14598-4311_t